MATDGVNDTSLERLRRFREEVSSLVKTIPGPLERLVLRAGEHELEVTWARPAILPAQMIVSPAGGAAARPGHVTETETETDEGIRDVVAPIVGTFYVAPEPGAAPFVQKGDRVEAGQIIGIVEAMKLMNEVPAEWAGEVSEILAGDTEPVEFDQPLVRIRLDRT
jgi:acetyl-CoA carboxylase biotin carboxyl carrier protein